MILAATPRPLIRGIEHSRPLICLLVGLPLPFLHPDLACAERQWQQYPEIDEKDLKPENIGTDVAIGEPVLLSGTSVFPSLLVSPYFLRDTQGSWRVKFNLAPCLGTDFDSDRICEQAATMCCERIFKLSGIALRGWQVMPKIKSEWQDRVPSRLAGQDNIWTFECHPDPRLPEPRLPPSADWPESPAPIPVAITRIPTRP
jgi:hypothetical protein